MTGMLGKIRRFFFQKASNDFDANEAFRRNQARYNALYALDPDVLVRHLAAFQRGDICGLERVLDEFEAREDKMRIGAFKMAAAVSSKPWEVRVRKGEEDNPRAKVHQAALTRFWNRAEATDAFCRNRRGGIRLLLKQMMQAQSRVYSVHDITWKVNGDGTLDATFTHVPAWCFENRTGRLRYIRNDGQTAGEEMPDGEWLVTVGEGVGVAAAILAMAKRLSWNDWLLFSEKCGMPVVIGRTNAQRGTPAWDQLARAIRAVAPKTGLVADTGSDISAVPMGSGGGKETYRDLVDTVDRAISALYRGGDLATVASDPDAAGVNAQAGESELMDADGCAMVSETLRDQVEKFVIRFECGDFEPLAEIVVNPPAETEDVDREMAIDNHLAALGVKLSKSEALARYGRTEAESDDDALEPAQPANPGGFGGFGLPNEAPAPHNPDSGVAKPLQNARRTGGATSVPPDAETRSDAILRDFAADMGPAAEKIKSLLDALDAGRDVRDEARRLAGELPDLMADDPAMAAVIEEAMAEAFADAAGEGGDEGRTTKDEGGAALANEITHPCPKCHRQMAADGTCSFCAKRAANHEAGKKAFAEVEKTHKDVVGAMERDSIGKIDFIWGDDSEGICHIVGKHPENASMIPGVIAYGDIYEDAAAGKYYCIKKRNLVVLRKGNGTNHYLITGYQKNDPKRVAEIRKGATLVEKGE